MQFILSVLVFTTFWGIMLSLIYTLLFLFENFPEGTTIGVGCIVYIVTYLMYDFKSSKETGMVTELVGGPVDGLVKHLNEPLPKHFYIPMCAGFGKGYKKIKYVFRGYDTKEGVKVAKFDFTQE